MSVIHRALTVEHPDSNMIKCLLYVIAVAITVLILNAVATVSGIIPFSLLTPGIG